MTEAATSESIVSKYKTDGRANPSVPVVNSIDLDIFENGVDVKQGSASERSNRFNENQSTGPEHNWPQMNLPAEIRC